MKNMVQTIQNTGNTNTHLSSLMYRQGLKVSKQCTKLCGVQTVNTEEKIGGI